jgi:PAS domain-containing protein
MEMENLKKIRTLVEELSIRDDDMVKKAEQTDILKEVFLKSPQAMAILEDNWKYVMVNENFAKTYGFTCCDEMVGKSHYELFSSIPDRPIKDILQTIESGGTWSGTIDLPHKEKGVFKSDVTIQKLHGKNTILFTIKRCRRNHKK